MHYSTVVYTDDDDFVDALGLEVVLVLKVSGHLASTISMQTRTHARIHTYTHTFELHNIFLFVK